MELDELNDILSNNHRNLILLGAIVSLISIFLPFWNINTFQLSLDPTYANFVPYLSGISTTLSSFWIFWIYLIFIAIVFIGYFGGIGEKYPYLFMSTGLLLVLITIFATQLGSEIIKPTVYQVVAAGMSQLTSLFGSSMVGSVDYSKVDMITSYISRTSLSLSYGFALALIGSIMVTLGGYYYYKEN